MSVVVAAFNADLWIAETLRSILEQTYADYEVIVVDDGSTDRTAAVVQGFSGRVRYLHQPNRGAAAARNTGIVASQGEFVAALDSDDLWLPRFLERTLPCFNDRRTGIVCSDVHVWNGRGTPEGSPRRWRQVQVPSDSEGAWHRLIGANYIMSPGVVIRRSVVDAVGGYDEELRGAEDYDLWLRIARAGHRFTYIDEPLAVYRHRSGSKSQRLGLKVESHLRIYEKWLSDRRLTREEQDLVRRKMRMAKRGFRSAGVDALLAGQFDEARRHFWKAVMSYPQDPRNIVGLTFAWIAPAFAAGLARQLRKRDPREVL